MADKKRYQVLTACVIVPIVNTDGAEYLMTVYTPGVFEADPNHPRIVHNLENGYIQELDAKATAGVDGAGVPVVDNKRADGTDVGSPVVLNDPGTVNDLAQERAKAAAKLPTDGSAPDGRASEAVMIEWLVSKGYSYDELQKQDKNELKRLVSSAK